MPSIDKKLFIGGWFLLCPESLVFKPFSRLRGVAFAFL